MCLADPGTTGRIAHEPWNMIGGTYCLWKASPHPWMTSEAQPLINFCRIISELIFSHPIFRRLRFGAQRCEITHILWRSTMIRAWMPTRKPQVIQAAGNWRSLHRLFLSQRESPILLCFVCSLSPYTVRPHPRNHATHLWNYYHDEGRHDPRQSTDPLLVWVDKIIRIVPWTERPEGLYIHVTLNWHRPEQENSRSSETPPDHTWW